MKLLSSTCLTILIASIVTFSSCTNKTEEFVTDSIHDFIPLTEGKYITYRMDSLVFPSFGSQTAIHKYQVKHIVNAKIMDAEGRPTYRIYKFIRDSVNTSSWTASQPWINAGTYYITPTENQIELNEDNLRIIKLHMPMREGFTWKGNKYLADNPYDTAGYKFSNDDNMEDWDFSYDSFLPLFNYRGVNYSNVYSVEQTNEVFNIPITIPTSYAAKSRAVEKYSKNIGLVYREFELWEYQPNTGGSGGPYKVGFGVTMWMIDHN